MPTSPSIKDPAHWKHKQCSDLFYLNDLKLDILQTKRKMGMEFLVQHQSAKTYGALLMNDPHVAFLCNHSW